MTELGESGFVINGVPVSVLIPKVGTTDGAGTAGGTTVVDSALLTESDDFWIGAKLVLLSGANLGQARPIVDFDQGTGTATVAPGFDSQVASGVKYLIVSEGAGALAAYILGSDNADNAFDSSNVVANEDGSVLERLEFVQALLGDAQQITWNQSEANEIDEDGGRGYYSVGVVDRDDGAVASGSIDITGATIEVAKSTGGGAFSAAGITQPTVQKGTGEVFVEFDFDASEWSVGDTYRVKLNSVTAQNSNGDTEHMPLMVWIGEIKEDLDLEATATDIDTDLGEPEDATTDTVHGKLGTDTEMSDNSLFDLLGASEVVTPAVSGNQDGDLRDRIDALSLALGVTAAGSGTGLEEDGTANLGTLIGIANLLSNTVSGDRDAGNLLARIDAISQALGITDAGAGTGFEEDGSLDLYELLFTGADTSSVSANEDGSLAERLEAVLGDVDTIRDAATTSSPQQDSIEDELDRLIFANEATNGSVQDAGATATSFDTSLTEATNDHYNGAVLIFTDGALAGQARIIEDYSGTGGTVTLHRALTEAPADTDGFLVIPGDYTALTYVAEQATPGSPVADSVADELDRILANTNQNVTAGTHTHADNTTEQEVFDDTTEVGSLQAYLDLSALTQDVTVRVYRRIDDSTLRLLKATTIAPGDPDGWYSDQLQSRNGLRVTVQSATTEGAQRSIPFELYTAGRGN